jgi:hypothetical protein
MDPEFPSSSPRAHVQDFIAKGNGTMIGKKVQAAGPPSPVARKPRMALRSKDRATAGRILPCHTYKSVITNDR